MNVNYDYYRIFYYVAKCGNLSQAARELVNNQPNLTRSIKNLEAELGCTLFSRTNRGMKLTPEGERLYRHVKIAVEQLEAGEAELAQSRSLQAGTVFLAASEGALRCVLLPVLEAFRTQYPGVSLRISNHSTPQAIAALRETTADFAVVTTPVLHAAAFQQTNIRQIQEVAGPYRHAGGTADPSAHHTRRGYAVLCALFRLLCGSRPAVPSGYRGLYRRSDSPDGRI